MEDTGHNQENAHEDIHPDFSDQVNLVPRQESEEDNPETEQVRARISAKVELEASHGESFLSFF
jgi:hypothetical protein